MIGVGYGNVAINVFEHEPSMSIHGSSCRDRVRLEYLIVVGLNKPYSFWSLAIDPQDDMNWLMRTLL